MTVAQRACDELLQTASSELSRSSDAVRYLYLMIPSSCCASRARTLVRPRRRLGIDTRSHGAVGLDRDELEEAMPADRQSPLPTSRDPAIVEKPLHPCYLH